MADGGSNKAGCGCLILIAAGVMGLASGPAGFILTLAIGGVVFVMVDAANTASPPQQGRIDAPKAPAPRPPPFPVTPRTPAPPPPSLPVTPRTPPSPALPAVSRTPAPAALTPAPVASQTYAGGEITPGTQLDRFVVEKALGEGGMARVYKVRHAHLGSLHALKVLAPELVANDEIRQRFLDEGRIQAQLRHPALVPVTDIVAVPGIAGLVMDLVDGEGLDKLIDQLVRPPHPEFVRAVFRPVLDGLAFAHARGIIHRDIKPSNVIVEQLADGRVHARVIDFGIAKVLGSSEVQKRATRTGLRMGTPHYMSPEQIRGARDVTPESDVFSLGATLYEFATGRLAFDAQSEFDIQLRITQGQFRPPAEVHPGIDPVLARAIERALSTDPSQRFRSCEEFARALG